MNTEDEKVLQPKIASREVTTHILKAFGLRMSKKLGQNFLIDARIVQGIVDAAEIKPGDRVYWLSTGAYTSSYCSVEFNGFPPLPVYIIK